MDLWQNARLVSAALALLGGGACLGTGTDGGGPCGACTMDAGQSGTDAGDPCGTPDAGTTGDFWCPINPVGAPPDRVGFLIWTGDEVLAFGGALGDARYDPVTDNWRPMSVNSAPGLPVWTGSEVLSLAGASGTGARYDPVADAWSPLSASRILSSFSGVRTAVWTGTDALLFGCDAFASGTGSAVLRAIGYELATDTWRTLSTTGAPAQLGAWEDHCAALTAVWTGSEAIVVNCFGEDTLSEGTPGQLGRYDPATDSWTADVLPGDWCSEVGYTSVWTGEEMILWGRRYPRAYNPATGMMRAISTIGAPYVQFRGSCPVVWTGSLVLVWGGGCDPYTGARYDPLTDTWSPITSVAAPPSLGFTDLPSVWTGTELIVWGEPQTALGPGPATGGRYTP